MVNPALQHAYVTHLGTPTFLEVHAYIHMSLQRVCLSSRGFLFREFCPGFFVWKVFVGSPSVIIGYICYNRKLYITLNFRFPMYEIFLSVTSHALGPLFPCHKL